MKTKQSIEKQLGISPQICPICGDKIFRFARRDETLIVISEQGIGHWSGCDPVGMDYDEWLARIAATTTGYDFQLLARLKK